MKIDINQIPPEGVALTEEFTPQEIDLETDTIKFRGKVLVKADVSKVANAVTVNLNFNALIYTNCSRCLDEFEFDFKKNIELNYPINPALHSKLNGLSMRGGVNKSEPLIDLDPDIREEIILDYPIKPLCKLNCRGLCPKCGKNLNEGKCSC